MRVRPRHRHQGDRHRPVRQLHREGEGQRRRDWTTAKTGTLSDDTVVAYFTKPGAAESDTRIWTYDAAVLEITGIPEDATVQLLDYLGDRVDFYEGATVGVLKDDYKYGDGQDDVIKKGDPGDTWVPTAAIPPTTM